MAHTETLAAGSVHAATCAAKPAGYAYASRESEKTALYQVFHRHLPRAGLKTPFAIARLRTSPSFVALHRDISANIVASGFALDSFSLGLGATNEF